MIKISKVGLSKKIFVVSLLFVIVLIFFVYHNTKIVKANDVDTALATYLAAAQKDPHNYYCGGMDWGTYQITAPFWWECHPVYVAKKSCPKGQAMVGGQCEAPKKNLDSNCNASSGKNTVKCNAVYDMMVDKSEKELQNLAAIDHHESTHTIVQFSDGSIKDYSSESTDDPGSINIWPQIDEIASYAEDNGLTIDAIVNIHNHPTHVDKADESDQSPDIEPNNIGFPPSENDLKFSWELSNAFPNIEVETFVVDENNLWQYSVPPDSKFSSDEQLVKNAKTAGLDRNSIKDLTQTTIQYDVAVADMQRVTPGPVISTTQATQNYLDVVQSSGAIIRNVVHSSSH